MKFISLVLAGLAISLSALGLEPKEEVRGKIGSVFAAPVRVGNQFYFVSTAGVLFEAVPDFTLVNKLFEGKKQSIAGVVQHDGKLYWGDGLHQDTKSNLHVFDLAKKKLDRVVSIDGHVERAGLVQDATLFLPAGPGGVAAVDLKTNAVLWQTKTFEGKPIHVDSNLVSVSGKICATSIYQTKGVICLEPKTGKVMQLGVLRRDPKSEITVWNNHIVGFATEADLMKAKFDIPADFYVYDVAGNKFRHNKELRGFNFFAPAITGNGAFITLSTGDFIIFHLDSGKIEFIGEFSEPFINNPFMMGENYCAIAVMGKFQCYLKTKSGFALTTDKRLGDTVIGKILVDQKLIAPTRVGYYVE